MNWSHVDDKEHWPQGSDTMSVHWTHGRNKLQEYFYPVDNDKLQVVRNLREQHWVIYDLRGDGVRMIANPYKPKYVLRFVEVGDIPAANAGKGKHSPPLPARRASAKLRMGFGEDRQATGGGNHSPAAGRGRTLWRTTADERRPAKETLETRSPHAGHHHLATAGLQFHHRAPG